jgi:hypothetical protein
MRRLTLAIAGVGLLLMAGMTMADSAHFLFANSSITDTDDLTVSFKEVGLGTGTTSVTITLSATGTAVYQCFNNGGNHPQAGNKETVSANVQASGQFPVSNGQTTASLTVEEPGPGGFACPSGQTLFVQSVTYSGISVSDAFSPPHSLAATPDPISTGTIHVPPDSD